MSLIVLRDLRGTVPFVLPFFLFLSVLPTLFLSHSVLFSLGVSRWKRGYSS